LTLQLTPIHQAAGAVTRRKADQNDLAPIALNQFAPDHLIGPVIRSFDEDPGLHTVDEFERRVLIEDDDEIDGFKRRKHLPPSLLMLNRAPFAFEARHRGIAVEPDDEPVAGGARLSQKLHVPGMQEIETTIGEADPQPKVAPFVEMSVERRPVEHG